MANELTKVELYGANNEGQIIRYTIADGTAVSQGATFVISDPRTVTPATAALVGPAGVACEEHVANQGVTSIGMWTDGIFEAVCSGSVTAGHGIRFVESNKVLDIGVVSGALLSAGYALETGSDLETINVRIKL